MSPLTSPLPTVTRPGLAAGKTFAAERGSGSGAPSPPVLRPCLPIPPRFRRVGGLTYAATRRARSSRRDSVCRWCLSGWWTLKTDAAPERADSSHVSRRNLLNQDRRGARQYGPGDLRCPRLGWST